MGRCARTPWRVTLLPGLVLVGCVTRGHGLWAVAASLLAIVSAASSSWLGR